MRNERRVVEAEYTCDECHNQRDGRTPVKVSKADPDTIEPPGGWCTITMYEIPETGVKEIKPLEKHFCSWLCMKAYINE